MKPIKMGHLPRFNYDHNLAVVLCVEAQNELNWIKCQDCFKQIRAYL